MKYIGKVWILRLMPGKSDCFVGRADDIGRDNDEGSPKTMDIEIAQKFDLKPSIRIGGYRQEIERMRRLSLIV